MTGEHKPTGNERVLALLRRGYWFTAAEIEQRCEVTCHSRISDLRHAGHVIDKRHNPEATGRRKYSYRLVATAEQVAEAREASSEDAAVVGAGAASSSDDSRSRHTHAETKATGDSRPEGETWAPSGRPAVLDEAGVTAATAPASSSIDGFTATGDSPTCERGESGSAAAHQTPAAADPSDDDFGDTGWRERFPPAQLQLGVGA